MTKEELIDHFQQIILVNPEMNFIEATLYGKIFKGLIDDIDAREQKLKEYNEKYKFLYKPSTGHY